ncbi:hypothetical protein F8G81_06435 [Arthrobacter sp. CDRTa11]|uniref:hypothetical protein n=1 Tax=Arthrobacter sp. CDRTa11 TaxID=2651199 RepID=UPI0022657EE2|nr:hypothetical protein [Arthrobacter sp. CDRTa11]UZX02296.1 hypothetical protein F8G81_06435 [Arthrobacter sp. CDRTa11]
MAKALSPWRVLRPVLLAGAATLTWLTFSTSAASADSSTESGSLLGGLTSSVSSISAPLTGTVSPAAVPAPEPAPAPAPASPGLLQPGIGSVAGAADQLVAAVPVVSALVPAGTVSTVSAPVAVVADEAAAGLVNAVAPPLSEAVPVLEPVLQPVVDVVIGVSPLPVSLPVLEVPAIGPLAGSDVPAGGLADGDVSAAIAASLAVEGPDDLVNAGGAALAPSALSLALAGMSSASTAAPGVQSSQPDVPGTGDPSPLSALAPAGPSSGAGSGSSAAGSSGSAALVDSFGLYLPLGGAYPISGFSEHAPSPVSFDPGSSPD